MSPIRKVFCEWTVLSLFLNCKPSAAEKKVLVEAPKVPDSLKLERLESNNADCGANNRNSDCVGELFRSEFVPTWRKNSLTRIFFGFFTCCCAKAGKQERKKIAGKMQALFIV